MRTILKFIWVSMGCLYFMVTGIYAGQAMVFFDPELDRGDWPPCVQTIRQIPGTSVFRVQYVEEDLCLTCLWEMDGVLYLEEEKTILMPDNLESGDMASLPDCDAVSGFDRLPDPLRTGTVTVAVIDTGVSIPLFREFLAVNTGEIPGDGIDNDMNGYVDDLYGWNFGDMNPDVSDIQGHGTQVTSVLLNTASRVSVLPVKVTTGMASVFSSGDAAEAIYYAVERGADILNLSFSSMDFSMGIYLAVNQALEAGILVVAAAGNDGGEVEYPAALDAVVAVGSHDREGMLSWFSASGDALDLRALGENVCATDVDGRRVSVDGTSFSAPMVSGAAAVLKAMNPHLTVNSLQSLLKAGTLDETDFVDRIAGPGNLNFDMLTHAVTPRITLPEQVTRGEFLDIGIHFPPTDVDTYMYLGLVSGNRILWLDSMGNWLDAEGEIPEPFQNHVSIDFTDIWIYGSRGEFAAIDTSHHEPGTYRFAAGMADRHGRLLGPVGWSEMTLDP